MSYVEMPIYQLLTEAVNKKVIEQFTWSNGGDRSIKIQAMSSEGFKELNTGMLDYMVDRLDHPEKSMVK